MFGLGKKTEYVFKVNGMHCIMCEKRVCDLIKSNLSVTKVTANHNDGKVIVLSKDEITASEIKSALSGTDFTVE